MKLVHMITKLQIIFKKCQNCKGIFVIFSKGTLKQEGVIKWRFHQMKIFKIT
ncbi:hypothetical protein M918_12325 [Clostridium sp. BL8]|nr:hypothetical protein M918_12325 [Clostridium sp. BL8]